MQFEGVKIRWFVENCFEIKLPNGKTIVIDPMLVREAGEDRRSNEDVHLLLEELLGNGHVHLLDGIIGRCS